MCVLDKDFLDLPVMDRTPRQDHKLIYPARQLHKDIRMSDNSTRRYDHVRQNRDCSCHDRCRRLGRARRKQWGPAGNGRLFARPRSNRFTDSDYDL